MKGPTKAKNVRKGAYNEKNEEKEAYEDQNEGNKPSKKIWLRKYQTSARGLNKQKYYNNIVVSVSYELLFSPNSSLAKVILPVTNVSTEKIV
jgi:hypothetical protein